MFKLTEIEDWGLHDTGEDDGEDLGNDHSISWLFSINLDNQNIAFVTVLFRGYWYAWALRNPFYVARWPDKPHG